MQVRTIVENKQTIYSRQLLSVFSWQQSTSPFLDARPARGRRQRRAGPRMVGFLWRGGDHESYRRREMYCGHARLCVCPRPHDYIIARTRM